MNQAFVRFLLISLVVISSSLYNNWDISKSLFPSHPPYISKCLLPFYRILFNYNALALDFTWFSCALMWLLRPAVDPHTLSLPLCRCSQMSVEASWDCLPSWDLRLLPRQALERKAIPNFSGIHWVKTTHMLTQPKYTHTSTTTHMCMCVSVFVERKNMRWRERKLSWRTHWNMKLTVKLHFRDKVLFLYKYSNI